METKIKKYIAVNYDKATQEKLRDWCEKSGLYVEPEFNFHTTIFYSNTEHPDLKNVVQKIPKSKVLPIKFAFFGDPATIPVLIISAINLKKIRNHYEEIGMKQDLKWKPHISLSYTETDVELKKLPLPDFDLYYDELVIESLRESI